MAMKKNETLLFILLIAVLVPLEVLSAYLAYETLGEIMQGIYFLAIGLNLLLIILAVYSRSLAAIGVVILALLLVPYQLTLGYRFIEVQTEVAAIVSHAYEQKIDTGEFPEDLTKYRYQNPDMEMYIQNYRLNEERGGFTVIYRVGTESTSHWFSSNDGWGYYPD